MSADSYVLGHSELEIQRLMFQAKVIRPISLRLLQSAGIAPGMRVLDLGCGAGDLALLAAELVGPEGQVTGIDRNARVLEVAAQQAQRQGIAQASFEQADVLDFEAPQAFDAVIGRYVLVHQPDPVAFLRAAAGHVRPGGVLALHEIAVYDPCGSLPRAPLYQQVIAWIVQTTAALVPQPEAAGRMIDHFQQAGLAMPRIFCEVPVDGGPDSPFYAWAADSLRALLPALVGRGIASEAQVDIDTLADRLREEAVANKVQMLAPRQFCAWTRLPA